MGFRIRKSFNVGGGFRITLSKSGVGYSWGTKGFRHTWMASGRQRQTFFIPGTGLSHVEESKGRPQSQPAEDDGNLYHTRLIENKAASAFSARGMNDMLEAAERSLLWDRTANVGMLAALLGGFVFSPLFALALLFLVLKIWVRTQGVIELNYSIGDDGKELMEERLSPLRRIAESARVWRIMQTSKVRDTKYTSGAGESVKRRACRTSATAPFPFRANVDVASFSAAGETLLFLPDRLIIISNGEVGALSYPSITFSASRTRFVESEGAPDDARVVEHTWRYVNKSGGPDRRFRDNPQMPVCLYGELHLSSRSGLNTVIMYSQSDIVDDIANCALVRKREQTLASAAQLARPVTMPELEEEPLFPAEAEADSTPYMPEDSPWEPEPALSETGDELAANPATPPVPARSMDEVIRDITEMLERDSLELSETDEDSPWEPEFPPAAEGTRGFDKRLGESEEELYARCAAIVLAERKASTSLLQRRLSIGYGRAAKMMDMLEQRGIISPPIGAERRRELLVP